MNKSGLFFALSAAVLILAGCQSELEGPNQAPPAAAFTVTFNTNGSWTMIPPQTVARGHRVEKPEPDPVRDAHTFLGWYHGSSRWFFDTGTITGPTTLTAQWAASSDIWHTVTFMDGNVTIETLQVPHGEIVHFYLIVPSKQNSTFGGWWLNGTEMKTGAVTGNMTLTAAWNETFHKWGDGSYQPLGTGDVLRHYANSENSFTIGSDRSQGMTTRVGWWNFMLFRRDTKLNEISFPTVLYTGLPWWDPEQGNCVFIDNPTGASRDPHVNWNRYIQWGLNIGMDTGYLSAVDQGIFSIANTYDRATFFATENNIEGLWMGEDSIRTHYWKFKLSPSFLEDDVERETLLFYMRAAVGPEAGADLLTLTANGFKNTLQLRHNNQGTGRVTTSVVFEVPLTEIVGKWTAIEITIHFRDTSTTRSGRENGYLYVKLTDREMERVLVEKGMFADMWRRSEVRNASGVWEEVPNGVIRDGQALHPGHGLRRSIAVGRPPKISMDWTDYYCIWRNKATYIFPTGHNPNDVGGIPPRVPVID
ncbi:MAG: InlB B-repeat-containing protein [Treponema sp.]|nr:InlB B-repeat-containing protein [Treponema sp.]